eukprot:1795533-Rhodomonas_salina.7
MLLWACYAMSGTEIPYALMCLRACYAMPGTELAYGAAYGLYQLQSVDQVHSYRPTRLPGTKQAYDATFLVSHYAMRGTDLPYGTTRAEIHDRGSIPYGPTHSLRSVQY